MKKSILIAFLLAAVFGLAASADAQLKKRVAVFAFEDKTDRSSRWWDGRAPGDGMADMLTTALVKSGGYTVVERKDIAAVLEEQRLGESGAVTQESAARLGKLLGVELAVVGSVTEFGHSKQDIGGTVKGFGLGVKRQKATVAVDVRLISTTTGEILKAEHVRREESSSGLSVSTREGSFNNETDFDNSIVGKATRAAIEDIVTLIRENAGETTWSGKVLLVKEGTVYFKPGQDGGVQIGDRFAVFQKGEDLIDPDTGLSLGSEERKIGLLEVTGFAGEGSRVSKAVVKAGSGIQTGDLVRLP
ncbi:MAG: CsgG/HfaB family protein [bacterium]|nr:CsgG/HfaB family protein [bacterium]